METAAPTAVAAKRIQDCWTAAPRLACITIMAVIAAQYGCGRRSSSAKYMARQPASAVFNASRKFPAELVMIQGNGAGRDYGPRVGGGDIRTCEVSNWSRKVGTTPIAT